MKSFPLYVLPLLAVWSWAGIAHAETAPLTLAQAKALVVQSPLLQAQKSRAKALAFKPEQAGSLPDPVVSLGAISFPVDTWKRGQENMTQLQVGISQALPFPGKLGLLEDAAQFAAKAGQEDVAELRLQLLSQVQVRWWNLYYLDKALDIVEKNKGLLRQFIKIAETKYKTGKGLQQDVLLAQLELSKLLDSQMQWQSLRQSEQARLNALLNQPASTSIVLPHTVDELLYDLQSKEALLQVAQANRPLLHGKQWGIDARQAQVAVAEKDFYPDFKISASYGARASNATTGLDRADLASLSLSFNIPFGDTQDAQLGQRKAEALQAEFAYEDALAQVQAEVGVALSDYQRAKQQASLFKQGIIPQARQTVASMLAAYQVNKVDFLNLVRTQITLYNYETQYWKVLAQAKQSLARLDAAVGKSIHGVTQHSQEKSVNTGLENHHE